MARGKRKVVDRQAQKLARGQKPLGISWMDAGARALLDKLQEQSGESRRALLQRLVREELVRMHSEIEPR